MAEAKRKLKSFVTPVVTLKYCYLNKPDEKYKYFSCQGILDVEGDPAHKAFIDKIKAEAKVEVDKMLADVDDKKRQFILKTYKQELPIKDELVEYQPTGKLVMKAKSNIAHPPSVFVVEQGKLVSTTKGVWGGSLGEIKVLMNPYVCDAQKNYGVSFLLSAVKVTKFAVSGTAPGAAAGFTAGSDTESYTPAVTSETPPCDSGASDDEGDPSAGNF